MPRPRLYKDNAARQKAYRERKAKAERAQPPALAEVTRRVMASQGKAE